MLLARVHYQDAADVKSNQLENVLKIATTGYINVERYHDVLDHELMFVSSGRLHSAPVVLRIRRDSRIVRAYAIKNGYKYQNRDVIIGTSGDLSDALQMLRDKTRSVPEVPQLRNVLAFSEVDINNIEATTRLILPDEKKDLNHFNSIVKNLNISPTHVRTMYGSKIKEFPPLKSEERAFYCRTLDYLTWYVYGELIDSYNPLRFDMNSRYFHQTLLPLPKTRFLSYPTLFSTTVQFIRIATDVYRDIAGTGRDAIKELHWLGFKDVYPEAKRIPNTDLRGKRITMYRGVQIDVSGHMFNMLMMSYCTDINYHLYLKHIRTNVRTSQTKARVPQVLRESGALDEMNGLVTRLWHNHVEYIGAIRAFELFLNKLDYEGKPGADRIVEIIDDVKIELGRIKDDYPQYELAPSFLQVRADIERKQSK
jgi:hypothetical protein